MSLRNLTADNLPRNYHPTDIGALRARLVAYVDHLEHNRKPVTEMVYDTRFRTGDWEHDVYVPMTADLRAILTELDRHERVVHRVVEEATKLAQLAPVNAEGETQWGATPVDTKLAELGRRLQLDIEEAWRGGPHPG